MPSYGRYGVRFGARANSMGDRGNPYVIEPMDTAAVDACDARESAMRATVAERRAMALAAGMSPADAEEVAYSGDGYHASHRVIALREQIGIPSPAEREKTA